MQKLLLKYFLFLVIFITSYPVYSSTEIIYDSEIYETFDQIVKPLANAAKIKNLKIVIFKDEMLNGFTGGSNTIFLSSGLIKTFSNIDVVRGVLAHEIGHIVGNHIFKQAQNIDSYNKILISTLAIGLITSLVSGNTDMGFALSLVGQYAVERTYLKYSRGCESAADQVALKLLEANGYSTKGMINFFEYNRSKDLGGGVINPYDRTHPLDSERLGIIKNFYRTSKFKVSLDNKELENKYQRARAKLIAFTTDCKKFLPMLNNAKFDEKVNQYAKAINYFKNSDLDNSLKYINLLINSDNQDPFYHELKGQILFGFGKQEALGEYNQAIKLRPDDNSFKLSRAIVGVNIYPNSLDKLKEFYSDLKMIVQKDKEFPLALYYLSIYNDKFGEKSKALLNLADIALMNNDNKKAKKLANMSLQGLIKGCAEWYKAHDIIRFTE